MRSALLVFILLTWPSVAFPQSALHTARDAAAAVTAHDHSTAQQADEALHAEHVEAPPKDHAAGDRAPVAAPGEATDSGFVKPGAMSADHAGHGEQPVPAEHVHPAPVAETSIGVTEKLGEFIAAEARFFDEGGKAVTMAEIVDKPTIIVPVYFSCPNVCAIIQSSLTAVLPDVKLEPGVDFQVVSVSFDDTDTPTLAAHQKNNYMAAMDFTFPENGWRFLTGDEANIRKLMDSLGFGFRREGKDFLHPVVVMAVSPKGKIVRYLYGTRPLAFDLTMAATEADKERIGLSVKRVLAYCFSYDPEGKRYAFNFMKITGTGILLILAVLLVSLVLAGRKKRTPRN
ncbi:SCO family protein [Desulfomicrobium baculatum]|uniref:Uncharacterized protein SCO1/SenC/PrrC n=1 Tax=Desulfomicrobium baculatum (strain DSM 4028 / VKM B-1378 / X) TaxID=525897 RepID=C7LU12_DESBD|nr:SCO family protein [Desulfomicrobium baculatum]ACU89635.1 uncharacterized protein SCO1/SenC/PrrC [Desulfomicrobium baculatum DSM 4028]